jgi:hypothetical protein
MSWKDIIKEKYSGPPQERDTGSESALDATELRLAKLALKSINQHLDFIRDDPDDLKVVNRNVVKIQERIDALDKTFTETSKYGRRVDEKHTDLDRPKYGD